MGSLQSAPQAAALDAMRHSCFAKHTRHTCPHTCAYTLQTAIAEGLAHAIVNKQNPDGSPLPDFLHNKRIMQLDVGLLMAGNLW